MTGWFRAWRPRAWRLVLPALTLFACDGGSPASGPDAENEDALAGNDADQALDIASESTEDSAPFDVNGLDPGGLDPGGGDTTVDTLAGDTPDALDPAADSGMADATASACAPDGSGIKNAQVITTIGKLHGSTRDGVAAFLGVPYAKPPVGPLRWAPPAPRECSSAPIDATAPGAVCPQMKQGVGAAATPAVIGDEDCLTLNAWAPLGSPPAGGWPMLVFIHGGGNVQGSAHRVLPGGHLLYDGTALASRGQVVATINYRLGPLGYLALDALSSPGESNGNWGLLDQLAALQWLRDNAMAFGASPEKMTIFGESAGGVDVCALLATSEGRKLVRAGIIESAFCASTPLEAARAASKSWAAKTPCADAPKPLNCLRQAPFDALLLADPPTIGIGTTQGTPGAALADWGPVVDGVLLSTSPLAALPQLAATGHRLIVGSNADELGKALVAKVATPEQFTAVVAAGFAFLGEDGVDALLAMYAPAKYASPQEALVQLYSDLRFTCPTRFMARAAASAGVSTWRYWFEHAPATANSKGATHGSELPYVFGTFDDIPLYDPTPADVTIAEAMGAYWTTFVAFEETPPNGLPSWPPYDAETDPSLVLGEPIAVSGGIKNAECDLWESLLLGQ